MKEVIVEQQNKILKLGRQGSSNPPTAATPTNTAYTRELNAPEDINTVESEPSILSTVGRKEAAERYEKETQEKKEREEWDRVEREEREEKKRQEKATLQAMRKEREEQEEREERAEKERVERDAREWAEREAKEQAEREVKELAERAVKEKMDRTVRERVEKEAAKQAAEKAANEARVQSARDAREKAERNARKKRERKKKRLERKKERLEKEEKERIEREEKEREEREKIEREEKEEAEREVKEKADREAEEREEDEKKVATSEIPSAWSSTVTRDDRSGLGGTSSGLPPIVTSSVTGGIFDGAGSFDFFATGKNNPSDNAEVELRTLSAGRDKDIDDFNLSEVPTPADPGKLDILEGLGVSTSAEVSATPKPLSISIRLISVPISPITTPAPIKDSDSARRDDLAQPQMAVKPVTEPVPRESSGWGAWGCSLLTNLARAAAEILSFLEDRKKEAEGAQDAAPDAEDDVLGAEDDASDADYGARDAGYRVLNAGYGAWDAEDGVWDAEDGALDAEGGASDPGDGAPDSEDGYWGAQDAVLGWEGAALPWLDQEEQFEWVNKRSGRKGKNREKSWITNSAQISGTTDRAGRGRKKNKRKRYVFL